MFWALGVLFAPMSVLCARAVFGRWFAIAGTACVFDLTLIRRAWQQACARLVVGAKKGASFRVRLPWVVCAGFGWFSSVAQAVLCVWLIEASCACMAAVLCLVRAVCVVCVCVRQGWAVLLKGLVVGAHCVPHPVLFTCCKQFGLAGCLWQGQQL